MAVEPQPTHWGGPSRRRNRRFRVYAPVDVTVLRSGVPDTVPGRSENLGAGGLAAVLAAEVKPGQSVGVEIRLPMPERPLRLRALVRHQSDLRCGLEFVGLLPEQKSAIRGWIASSEAASKTETSKQDEPQKKVDSVKVDAIKVDPAKDDPAKFDSAKFDPVQFDSAKFGSAKFDSAKFGSTKKSEPVLPPLGPAGKGSEGIGTGGPSDAAKDGGPGRGSANSMWKIRPLRRGWIFLLMSAAILVAVLWWRWNLGWEELELGLRKGDPVLQPQATVPADVMEKLVIHRVDPEYPEEARQGNLRGVIVLDVIVGADGMVAQVRPLNGPEVLAQSAADAMRWWRFKPYMLDGKPVMAETTVAVEFKP